MKDFDFDVFAILALQFHIVSGIFSEKHTVTDLEEFRRIRTVFSHPTFAERKDNAFLRLFTGCGIGDDNAGSRDLLFFKRLDDDAVADGLNEDRELNGLCHGEGREMGIKI